MFGRPAASRRKYRQRIRWPQQAAANDAQLLDAIGSFYNSVGEHQKASDAYSRAIRLDPSQALFWFNRATVRAFWARSARQKRTMTG